MTAVAWWILVGGIVAGGSGLLHDRGGIYAGLVVMAAVVLADWYDRRQRERREEARIRGRRNNDE